MTGVRESARLAVFDLYYHSIRLVPANLAWGLGFAVLLSAVALGAPLVVLIGAPLLALPLVAIARLSGSLVREEDIVLSDAWHAARELARPALVSGTLITIVTLVLASNVQIALHAGTPSSIAVGVAAGWGLVALWLLAFPFWILLADPARAGRGALAAAREAAALLLVAPGRLLALAVVISAVLLIGSVLVAAVLTVAVAYAALVTAHVVLPVADRLAGSPGLASLPD
jgi:hypothetical protein